MEYPTKNVRSILIIDDDREDYELVMEAMQEINPSISVSYIRICEDVVKYRHEKFDLLLLDINMPHYDGFYWLKAIRQQGYSNLPIIIYTNSLSPSHISKAYEEGANLYFSKPESYSGLVKSLQQLVGMDWSKPFSITRQYINQGHYKTFQVN